MLFGFGLAQQVPLLCALHQASSPVTRAICICGALSSASASTLQVAALTTALDAARHGAREALGAAEARAANEVGTLQASAKAAAAAAVEERRQAEVERAELELELGQVSRAAAGAVEAHRAELARATATAAEGAEVAVAEAGRRDAQTQAEEWGGRMAEVEASAVRKLALVKEFMRTQVLETLAHAHSRTHVLPSGPGEALRKTVSGR